MGTSTPVCTVVSSIWRTSRWTRTEDVNTCLYRDQFHLEDVEVADVIETYVPEEIWKLESDKNTRNFRR